MTIENATVTSVERGEPRAMLALITLAELPIPKSIYFYRAEGILALNLDSIADGHAWAVHLGSAADMYVNKDGRTYLRPGVIDWRGWSVSLHASEDRAPDIALDENTTAHLQALAASTTGNTR
jgi:hypothetical protein